MSVLPRLQVGSWSAFAGPAIPTGGTYTGPAGTVDESSVAVSWRASGTVKVSLVGASTITVGSGPGGDVRLTVPNGRYAFEVENTSGSALASFEVSMRAADRIGDLVGAITDTGGQVFNVMAYGAVGDGITDDTAAIQVAINACAAAGGGIVFLPVGTYVISATLLIPSFTRFRGSSRYGSEIFLADGAIASGSVFGACLIASASHSDLDSLDRTIEIANMRVNGNAANNPITTYDPGGILLAGCDDVYVHDVDIVDCTGYCALYQSGTEADLGQSPNMYGLRAARIKIEGYVATSASGTTSAVFVSSINTRFCSVKDSVFIDNAGQTQIIAEDGARNAIFTDNVIIGAKASGIAIVGGSGPGSGIIARNVIEGSGSATINGIGTDQGISRVIIDSNYVSGFNNIGIVVASSSGTNTHAYIANNVVDSNNVGISVNADTTDVLVSTNTVIGTGTGIIANSPTVRVEDNNVAAMPTPLSIGSTGTIARRNAGYNPVGITTVAVPASGSATAALPYDATFYVTASTSTVACAITDAGGTSQTVATIPASGFGAVFVPAGSTLTPTYTVAPTWTVQGH